MQSAELRAALSPYERGRIAVIAAQQEIFANTEAAVAGLFSAASKAKRSKTRSFSLNFEEMGTCWNFPRTSGSGMGCVFRQRCATGRSRRCRRFWRRPMR